MRRAQLLLAPADEEHVPIEAQELVAGQQRGGFGQHDGSWERAARGDVRCGRPVSAGHVQEVPQQFRPFEGQETLGVELHAVQRPGAVAHAHDLAFVGPGADDEVGVV